eukprot:365698-Chlamydomonas_euryale.AAC.13
MCVQSEWCCAAWCWKPPTKHRFSLDLSFTAAGLGRRGPTTSGSSSVWWRGESGRGEGSVKGKGGGRGGRAHACRPTHPGELCKCGSGSGGSMSGLSLVGEHLCKNNFK